MNARVREAVRALRAGGLVALPTETVYGLAADATNADALRRLYAVKGRPTDHPVIVHVAGLDQLDAIARYVPDWARALAGECWPGPLTLVVARRPGTIADEVTGGRDTVGVRVPAHPLTLELLRAFDACGVAAPSANRFGRVSPTTAEHVRADLGDDVDLVLDGGPCTVGVESTIVDATTDVPRILREGAVTVADVERITGLAPEYRTGGEIAAPGTLVQHYAPRARVVLTDDPAGVVPEPGIVVLALAGVEVPAGLERLDAPADAAELAQVLYARLREADARGAHTIVVVPPAGAGIAAAVRDRLGRAAAASEH